MAVDSSKVLGYGGSGVINNIQVLMNSMSLNRERSIGYQEMLSVPYDNAMRSKVSYGTGTLIINGSMSFDITANALNLFSNTALFQRGFIFPVALSEGLDNDDNPLPTYKLENCLMSSISLNGSPGGLLTASVNFISAEDWIKNDPVVNDFIRDEEPYGYWYSGNIDVSDWTFNVNQTTSPVYTNENTEWPKYIRYGLWEISLETTTYVNPHEYDVISVATKTFKIIGKTTSQGYEYGGQTDMNTYSHTFSSSIDPSSADFGNEGSGVEILTIT
jgi:hypothetical protein